MASTPKHLYLYEAFGWQPPVFAHVGLLQDGLGQKLSKRNLDVDISAYRRMGILPGALVNYLALLGWSHGEVSDVMTMEQLIQRVRARFSNFLLCSMLRRSSSTSSSQKATRLSHLKSSGIYKGRTPRLYLAKAGRSLMLSSTTFMNM